MSTEAPEWDESYLYSLAVYSSVLLCISCVLYLYGTVKWVQWQQHWMVIKRFPAISNAIIMLSCIISARSFARCWIEYSNRSATLQKGDYFHGLVKSTGPALSFVICGLVIYRVVLVYFRWKNYRSHQLSTVMVLHNFGEPVLVNQASLESSNSHSKPLDNQLQLHIDIASSSDATAQRNKKVFQYLFFLYLICGTLYMLLSIAEIGFSVRYSVVGMFYTFLVLFGVILCIFIRCKHVNEGIGILFESYMTLLFSICSIIFAAVAGAVTDNINIQDSKMAFFVMTVSPLQGLFPIYITLYYIRKCEKTLNIKVWRNRFNGEIYEINNIEETDKANIDNDHENDVNLDDLNLPCLIFLKKKKNCEEFAKYLKHCFAVENLLFMQKTSILYQLVLKLQSDNKKQSQESTKRTKIQHITFEYCIDIYKEFTNKIKQITDGIDNKNNDNNKEEYYRDVLYQIYHGIYEEFVKDGGISQINISVEVRLQLVYLFESNTNTLQTFDDYKYVWDECLIEVYQMILSIYGYGFRMFLLQQKVM